MKFQTIACAVAIATGGLFFTHVVNDAIAANSNEVVSKAIQPSQEQALVSRQLATLVDRQHYLNMRLDAQTSQRIFDFYIDSLDPEHSLFLAPEVENYKKRYGANFGANLKAGNLSGPYEMHAQYQQRLHQFYTYMLNELKKPQNLNQPNVYIETDREKAPFFKTEAEQRAHWSKMLVSQLINLTISKEEELAKQKALKANPELANGQDLTGPEDLTPAQTLTKRYTRQLERLSRVKSDDVLDKTLNAMMLTYDPHSNYFPPVDAMELNRQTTLQLEGVGVSIRPERGNEDYTKIETIVEGGPASKSGQVKSGDRIIGVAQDGEQMVDVIGWPSNEIVGLIRGKRGTKVTLRLLGAGAAMGQARNVTITRDVIQEEDAGVRTRVVDIQRDGKKYQYGVIEIPSFYLNYRARRAGTDYRSVSEDTNKALKELAAKNVAGIIIDLRNNPGGSLEEVARMLGQVIKSGPVVQIRDGNGNVSVFEDDDGGAQTYAGPLAVMVNLASASASEIYSAAIQDYERGIVIGSTTTGKGTAQVQLDSLAHGQATLTQRKFYRVTGGSTQNKGVVPDIKLVDIYNEEFGERKAKNALQWDTIPTAPFKREGAVQKYVPELAKLSQQRVTLDSQFKYLEQRKAVMKKAEEEKRQVLDLQQRKAELIAMEQKTLDAENTRRAATGLKPYPNWESYQASLDALIETRAKMKAKERPALPEEEAFVIEAANVLLDYAKLQAKP
ncbi:carboxy terminal-processing peptidase [Acinetobacter lwoffii]|uniref:carboxy terminal-processing peptidase n=1 Tax=Acinetobacter lwoffii TaxID=28090 RepID=UPI00209B71F4|nr:carboxy terminal-processing peptidase [Acinetobacter lwoffii]MCO8061467.1 carboxy terminal-processing peptidase [Acinetobacter lwoffii]MCO8079911.1 carboxy terminal-processing peptidase [Acinetobacter lwoffii]MCO8094686.1 carboxy terminal-processing peptidase [Acinetobacter lwoffii]